jgi:hypothetical protein
MKLILCDKKGNKIEHFYDEIDRIMHNTGLVIYGCDFEEIGLQSDGTIIICNKCGQFEYIDSNLYSIKIGN